jgi:hypothetical protein
LLSEIAGRGEPVTDREIAHEDSLSQAEVDLSKERLAIL